MEKIEKTEEQRKEAIEKALVKTYLVRCTSPNRGQITMIGDLVGERLRIFRADDSLEKQVFQYKHRLLESVEIEKRKLQKNERQNYISKKIHQEDAMKQNNEQNYTQEQKHNKGNQRILQNAEKMGYKIVSNGTQLRRLSTDREIQINNFVKFLQRNFKQAVHAVYLNEDFNNPKSLYSISFVFKREVET
jgi:hypothetical protein